MLALQIPKNTEIIVDQNWIQFKGPQGIIKKKKSPEIKLIFEKDKNILWLLNSDSNIRHFYMALINKILIGIWKGYRIKLNIVGVGYKAIVTNNILNLKIGFCHTINYTIPDDIKIIVTNQKNLTLIVTGKDFQRVTQVAAEIRALKPVEPYKGKGIKYMFETIKRKEGKKTNV